MPFPPCLPPVNTSTSALSGLFADWYWEMDAQLQLTLTSEPFTAKTGLDAADDYWEHNRRSLERHEPFRDFEIQRPLARRPQRVAGAERRAAVRRRGRVPGLPRHRPQHHAAKARRAAPAPGACGGARARPGRRRGRRDAGRPARDLRHRGLGLRPLLPGRSGERRDDAGGGWFAREPATEQFLGRSRNAWQEGKPVFAKSPHESTGAFATFAFPAVAQGRTMGCSPFSGHRPASPTSACWRRRRPSAACSASSCSASRPRRCCARARSASAA